MTKYLKEDIIGAMSRYLYGSYGEPVQVLEVFHDMTLVQIGIHNRFFVHNNQLLDERPEPRAKEEIKPPSKKRR